jgi:hypothetical protein
MSAYRGRPEVTSAGQSAAIDPWVGYGDDFVVALYCSTTQSKVEVFTQMTEPTREPILRRLLMKTKPLPVEDFRRRAAQERR